MIDSWNTLLLTLALLIPVAGSLPAQDTSTVELPRADAASVGLDSEKLARVKPALQQFVDDQRIAGAVIAVSRRGKLVMLEAVGMQDCESSTPMSTDTVFRIYSMTKPIATVAALTLVDEGKLKLDDPVAKYIPEFADATVFAGKEGDEIKTQPLRRAVTIRDLMRHSSGLTYGFFGNSPVEQLYVKAEVLSDDEDTESLAAKVAAIPLMNQPGDAFQYGVSVDVLGRIIEVVSGQPLDQFLQERIFDPLGMRDSGFSVPPGSRDRFATCYMPDARTVQDAPETSRFVSKPKMLSGGGGLVSTAGDYLRFAQMVLNGGQLDGKRILRAETVAAMTSNQLPSKAVPISVGSSPLPGVGFGLGFSVVVDQQNPPVTGMQGEYGWDGMASTHYWASADEELAVVILTQRYPFSPQVKLAIRPLVYDAIAD